MFIRIKTWLTARLIPKLSSYDTAPKHEPNWLRAGYAAGFFILFFLALELYSPHDPVRAAGIPKILSFQGRLFDTEGNLLSSTTTTNYCFRFSIYDAASTVTGTQAWPSSTPLTMTIPVRNGVFSAPIGDTFAGSNALYDVIPEHSYLNIEIAPTIAGTCSGVTVFETLLPRQRIIASAFALAAGAVIGVGHSSIGTTTPLADTALTIVPETPTTTALGIRANPQQSADIVRIETASGSPLARITSDGTLAAETATFTRATTTLLYARDAGFSTVSSTYITATSGIFSSITLGSATASVFFANALAAASTNLNALTSTAASIDNLYGTNAILSAITSTIIDISDLAKANNALIANGTSTNFYVSNLFSSNTSFDNTTATNLTSTNQFSENGTITNFSGTNVQATNATTTNLTASMLSASTGTISNIVFTSATGGNATLTNLNAASATLTSVTAAELQTTGTSTLSTTTISHLTVAGNSAVNGNATTTGDQYIGGNLTINGSISGASLSITDFSTANFSAVNGTFTNITTTRITSTEFTSLNGSITNVLLTDASSTNLFSTNSEFINQNVLSGTSTNQFVTNLTATNATSTNQFVANLTASNATSTNLAATNAFLTTVIMGNASSTNFFATNLTTTNATSTNQFTTNITATNETVTNLLATNATSTNLAATNFAATTASTTDNGSVGGNFGVAGNTTLSGTLAVTGTSTFATTTIASSTILGSEYIGGNLTVVGSISGGSLAVTDFNTTNLVATNGQFTNITSTRITSTDFQSTNGTVTNFLATNITSTNITTTNFSAGTVSTTGNSSVGGAFSVTGLSTLGTVSTTGNSSVGGSLSVSGIATLTTVSTTGNSSIGGNLTVVGSISGGSLAVSNLSTTNLTATNALLTNATTTNATTTNLYINGKFSGAGLTSDCSGVDKKLTWNATTETFSCATDISGNIKTVSSSASAALGTSQTLLSTITITPQSTASEVWLVANIQINNESLLTGRNITMQLRRGSSCATSSAQVGINFSAYLQIGTSFIENLTGSFIDAPATSSIVTYALCAATDLGAPTVTNRSITAQEVNIGADLAEVYYSAEGPLSPGDVVELDPSGEGKVRLSSAYSTTALGFVATRPGLVLSNGKNNLGTPVTIALSGRVPVKVSSENGPILPGDLLSPSSIKGTAMKTTSSGMILGQALTSFNGEGTGTVIAFIKNTYFTAAAPLNPSISSTTSSPEMTALLNSTAALSTTTLALSANLEALRGSFSTSQQLLNDLKQHITSSTQPMIDWSELTSATTALIFDRPIIFKNGLHTDSVSPVTSLIKIDGDIAFTGRARFNADTAGFAAIVTGSTRVDIAFEKPFIEPPVINAVMTINDESTENQTALLNHDVRFAITRKSTDGFSISLHRPAPAFITFDWIAFAIDRPRIFVSPQPTPLPTPIVSSSLPSDPAILTPTSSFSETAAIGSSSAGASEAQKSDTDTRSSDNNSINPSTKTTASTDTSDIATSP